MRFALLILLWSSFVSSAVAKSLRTTTDQVMVAACRSVHKKPTDIDSLLKELVREGEFDVAFDPKLHYDPNIPDHWPGKFACADYINPLKRYGPVNRFLMQNIDSDQFKNFSRWDRHDDLMIICPTYERMSPRGRLQFMIWAMTSAAFYEDTCGRALQKHLGKGPNGKLGGHFQLHFGQERRYSAKCDDYDSCDKRTSALCAASTLDRDIGNNHSLFAKPGDTYWDVFKRDSKPAMANCMNIAKYKACGNSDDPKSARSYKNVCDLALGRTKPALPKPSDHKVLRITIRPMHKH